MNEIKSTKRGFKYITFKDVYGEKCSIQDSSLATESAVWIGIDKPTLKTLVRDVGWVTIPLHKEVSIFGNRMHLTQKQVKELLPILQRFVDTGTINI